MASAKGIRAGRAFVELFADDSKLVRGLRRAEQRLKNFGASIRGYGLKLIGLGSMMLAPLLASAKLFASYGDSVAKMSRRTGLSVEALSELQFAAGQSGVEVSALENGIRRMQRTIYDAERGLSTATDALHDLGMTSEDLAGLSPEEQFKLLADRISQVEDPTRRAALAMTIFGRSGTQLLPMFASGAKGIEILQAEARRLGLTMKTEDAQAAEAFTDAMDKLWKVIRMGVFHIGAALAPTLQRVTDQLIRVAMIVGDWIRANQQLIVTVLRVAAAIIAAGIALVVLGSLISGVGVAIGILITVVTTVIAVLKLLVGVILLIVSPIGLVIAAVAALGAYLVYTSGIGAQALQWLSDRFNRLREDALASFGGIADALAAGDISLAIKILWLMIRMEWTRGINALEKAWLQFRGVFIRIGVDAWHGLLTVAETIRHALEVGWIETTAFFATTWQKFIGFFSRTWESVKAGAQKAWNWIKSLFDDSFDLQTENKFVEDQKKQALAAIDDEQVRGIAAREAKREAARQRAAAEHEATLGGIGQMNMEKHRELERGFDQQLAENETDLARARAEWRAAVEQAKQKRGPRNVDTGAGDGGIPGVDDPDEIIRRARESLAGLGDIGEMVEREAAKIGVKGTFNAAALQGLLSSPDDAADRTAKATEETAKHTKRLAQAAKSGGLSFT